VCVAWQVKCDHYWPFTDEPVLYGEVSVEMLSEAESPEWTIRSFRLGYVSGDSSISQLTDRCWPLPLTGHNTSRLHSGVTS